MAGRPSKPVELILIEGNKDHRTKTELKVRKDAEQALYTGFKFREMESVKRNPAAHAQYMRLKKLYKKIAYIDALDEQIINRYCKEISVVDSLEERMDKLDDELENCKEVEDRLKIYDMQNKIQASMNKSKELLIKYEDRLFLNPAGRIKSIPKKPSKEGEKPEGIAAYLARKRAEGQ
jgi:hypothetical protein